MHGTSPLTGANRSSMSPQYGVNNPSPQPQPQAQAQPQTQPALQQQSSFRSSNNNSPMVPPRPGGAALPIARPYSQAATTMQEKLNALQINDGRSTAANRNAVSPQPQQPQPQTASQEQATGVQRDHNADIQWYKDMLTMSLSDGTLTSDEDRLLSAVRTKMSISDAEHERCLKHIGWTLEEFNTAKNKDDTADAAGSNDKIEEGRECVVCLARQADHVIIDCMHLCLCGECARQYKATGVTICPKCRATIKEIKKTFF
jgi:hypothetical protein